jgi:hypothetical protein
MASWLAMAIALVLAAVGLGLAGFAASLYLRYRAMAAWPVAPGQVAITGLDAERRIHRHAARLVHIPTVAYRYSVSGVDQIGSRLSNVPTLFEHEDEAKAFLARFPEGTALKVRYNPAAPQDCVIEPRAPKVAALVAGAVAALGAAAWVLLA